MKKLILILFATLTFVYSQSQDKKDLKISPATGVLTSPYYLNANTRPFYNLDFDYYLAKRHIISANFNAGSHNYDDTEFSNVPSVNDKSYNAKINYSTFSIIYKYNLIHKNRINLAVGTGLGILNHRREYNYNTGNSGSTETSAWSDLVFPVRVEFDYKLSNRFYAGVIAGFFIHPDFPILAYHAGPKIGYLIK